MKIQFTASVLRPGVRWKITLFMTRKETLLRFSTRKNHKLSFSSSTIAALQAVFEQLQSYNFKILKNYIDILHFIVVVNFRVHEMSGGPKKQ